MQLSAPSNWTNRHGQCRLLFLMADGNKRLSRVINCQNKSLCNGLQMTFYVISYLGVESNIVLKRRWSKNLYTLITEIRPLWTFYNTESAVCEFTSWHCICAWHIRSLFWPLMPEIKNSRTGVVRIRYTCRRLLDFGFYRGED